MKIKIFFRDLLCVYAIMLMTALGKLLQNKNDARTSFKALFETTNHKFEMMLFCMMIFLLTGLVVTLVFEILRASYHLIRRLIDNRQ